MATALLIIDMLNDFILKKGKLFCGESAEKIVPAIKREIEDARRKNMPTLYICDSHLPSDSEFKMFPPHCLVGTKGAEVIDELKPRKEDYIIKKRRFSSFFQTDLDLTLRELKVSKIYLTGVCTNICVLYTAADARMLNYEVVVIKEGVTSFDESAHQFALNQMKNVLGCKIKSNRRRN